MHPSVVLLLGLVQMSRAYLATATHLPRLDATRRHALGGYVAFTVVAAVNLSGVVLNYYTIRLNNILVLSIIKLLLLVTVVAYRQRLPLARPYLLANVLPLLGVMGVRGRRPRPARSGALFQVSEPDSFAYSRALRLPGGHYAGSNGGATFLPAGRPGGRGPGRLTCPAAGAAAWPWGWVAQHVYLLG